MRLVPTPVASRLTGLSTEKLREWTIRRALVPADMRPKQKGSPAQFSWQTILVLRIAVLLREQFSVELQAHMKTFENLREEFHSMSFIALWGRRLALSPQGKLSLLRDNTPLGSIDAIVIHLDPHLVVIRDGFSLPDEVVAEQLDLFSLPSIKFDLNTEKKTITSNRRQSA